MFAPVGALSLLLMVGCAKTAPSRAAVASRSEQLVEVVPLARQDLVERLTLVGSIAARESAEVRAETAGVVREIAFVEGSVVTKGQVLLRIDDTELQAQLHEAEAALQLADANLRRLRGLAENRTISQADYESAQAQFRTAQARAELQRSRMAKTMVRAPFDGVAGGRQISPGDYVNNQTSITTITDVSRLKIEFQVPEAFLNKVHPGTTFTVDSRSLDLVAPVQGEVYFVNLGINRDTRSTEVKGWLVDPPPEFKPGMFGNIELVLAVRRQILVVPESALLVTREGMRITVVDATGDGPVAKYVGVTAGMRAGGMVEIEPEAGAGLADGQPVVASGIGAVNLSAGRALKLVPLRDELLPTLGAVD